MASWLLMDAASSWLIDWCNEKKAQCVTKWGFWVVVAEGRGLTDLLAAKRFKQHSVPRKHYTECLYSAQMMLLVEKRSKKRIGRPICPVCLKIAFQSFKRKSL